MGWYQFGGYKARSESGITGVFVSRPLIESVIRNRVGALPNVRVVEACTVGGLLADDGRVAGVTCSHKASGFPKACWSLATRSAASSRSLVRA